MDHKSTLRTVAVLFFAVSALLAPAPCVAQGVPRADTVPPALTGTESTKRALATLIGDSEGDADVAAVLNLMATPAAELGISSEEKANLLFAGLPLLEAAGKITETGTALKHRMDLHLVAGEMDEVWAERAQDYATWLAANGKREEAVILQREAVKVIEGRLGISDGALIPYLEALHVLLPEDSAEAKAVADRFTALKARLEQISAALVVMGPAKAMALAPAQRPAEKVRVYYATSRKPQASKKLVNNSYYSDVPGPLLYGSADVLVPQRIGDLASRTSIWALEVKSASLKRTNVISVRAISDPKAFFGSVKDSSRGEILIYVHGFNMTFSDALKATANLAVDLDLRGPAVTYSWPSAGSLWKYWRDGGVIADPETRLPQHLAGLMGRLSQENPSARIMLVAHSMGNRIAVPALADLGAAGTVPKLANVVLASADIGKSAFQTHAKNVAKATERLTIYASGDDVALKISAFINGEPRTGSPKVLTAADPGEKIDTTGAAGEISEMSADYLGHSDYLRPALADMRALLWQRLSLATRCTLKAAGDYFAIVQERCSAADFTDALVLRRRLQTKAASLAHVEQRIALALADAERTRWARVETIARSLP